MRQRKHFLKFSLIFQANFHTPDNSRIKVKKSLPKTFFALQKQIIIFGERERDRKKLSEK